MIKELKRLNISYFGLGLPALAGVALGVRLYTGGWPWCLSAAGVLLALWAFMFCGRFMVTTLPCYGAWIIDTWIASAVLVTGFITDLVLWLTLSTWFPAFLGNASGQPLEKLSATLVGAVTTFTALVWTKDIADAKGYFWPATQFRFGLECLYNGLPTKPADASQPYYAIFMDTVPDSDIDGWSFFDRHARAAIVANYMRQVPK